MSHGGLASSVAWKVRQEAGEKIGTRGLMWCNVINKIKSFFLIHLAGLNLCSKSAQVWHKFAFGGKAVVGSS